jgi:hypothetical protein
MSVAGDVRLRPVTAGAAVVGGARRRVARSAPNGGSDASTHTADSRTDVANNVFRRCSNLIRPPLGTASMTGARLLIYLSTNADRPTVSVEDMVAARTAMSRRHRALRARVPSFQLAVCSGGSRSWRSWRPWRFTTPLLSFAISPFPFASWCPWRLNPGPPEPGVG